MDLGNFSTAFFFFFISNQYTKRLHSFERVSTIYSEKAGKLVLTRVRTLKRFIVGYRRKKVFYVNRECLTSVRGEKTSLSVRVHMVPSVMAKRNNKDAF